MIRRLTPLLALLATVLMFAADARAAQPAPARAPGFHLAAVNGFVTLDSLRGKAVLVDFWASWCAPCKRSFPWMSALQDSLASHGLEIVAINLDKDRDAADRFLEQNKPRFTVVFDPGGETAEAYHVAAMPTSFLIGPDGTVLMTHAGFDSHHTAEFEAAIRKACPK
jgi:cytochrome c biogenesis protein CcmG/thiol:disulfide interchange protein DsbE